MDFIEVTAKTVDDAITEALVTLGTTSDQIEYEVIEKGSSGFLGFNSKPARIKVRRKFTVKDNVQTFLQNVFEAMDMKVEIIITDSEEENVLNVELKGDDMGVLIVKEDKLWIPCSI